MSSKIEQIENKTCYAIALRGAVLFPGISTSFELSRKASVKAMREAESTGSEIFIVTQKDSSVVEPKDADLFRTGVIARIVHTIKLSNGNWQLMVEGLSRAELVSFSEDESGTFVADVLQKNITYELDYFEVRRAIHECTLTLEDYLKFFTKPSEEVINEVKKITDPAVYADTVASSFLIKIEEKQEILDIDNPIKRIEKLTAIFDHEIELMELEGSIHARVRQHLNKTQRDIYLREQLHIIENELGIDDYDEEEEESSYAKRIRQHKLPAEVQEALLAENAKLKRMQFGSPEATVIRNYIETCLELPWGKTSKDRTDITIAKRILDEDHDGLTKVKERILEFMAVRQLSPELDGQILCLVGPPGVGKTSIVKSIARATNRKYVRIALAVYATRLRYAVTERHTSAPCRAES